MVGLRTTMLVVGAVGAGSVMATHRWKPVWRSYGEEMSPEKQERVKRILRNSGYSDFTNVELRQTDSDDIFGIGGGRSVLMFIPRSYTASRDDKISTLFPSPSGPIPPDLTVGDVEDRPGLREQLMKECGIFVKTRNESDHLINFNGIHMRKEYNWLIQQIQAGSIFAFAASCPLLFTPALRRSPFRLLPFLVLGISLSVYTNFTEKCHKFALQSSLLKFGGIQAATSVTEAQQKYNLIVRKEKDWRGFTIDANGDDWAHPPTSSKRIQFINEYVARPSDPRAVPF